MFLLLSTVAGNLVDLNTRAARSQDQWAAVLRGNLWYRLLCPAVLTVQILRWYRELTSRACDVNHSKRPAVRSNHLVFYHSKWASATISSAPEQRGERSTVQTPQRCSRFIKVNWIECDAFQAAHINLRWEDLKHALFSRSDANHSFAANAEWELKTHKALWASPHPCF